MLPDLPTRLARKRHSYGLMHGVKEQTCVVCEHTAAAIKEALSLGNKVCGICWTSSWTPIPPEEEKDCGLNHPHEGDHARCECCWLHERLPATRRKALEEAEKRRIEVCPDHPMSALKAALAAHQAVVRELAEASRKYVEEVQANLRAAQSHVPGPPEPPRWAALQHLQACLARPLVVAAREAPHV